MPASIVAAALNFFFVAVGLFASSSLPPLASSMAGCGGGAPRADIVATPSGDASWAEDKQRQRLGAGPEKEGAACRHASGLFYSFLGQWRGGHLCPVAPRVGLENDDPSGLAGRRS